MDATLELLLAIGLILFVGIGTFTHRRSALRGDAVKSAVEEHAPQSQERAAEGQVDIVIKCVSCGSIQIGDDEWFSAEDIRVPSAESDILGGVCPDCRIASDS